MEKIKNYVISVFKRDGLNDFFVKQVLKMSEERIQWIYDVAWNLARITGKYDRFAISKELSVVEYMILCLFEAEETELARAEDMRKHNEWRREQEEWWREYEKRQREQETKRASASLNYLFPIGEA